MERERAVSLPIGFRLGDLELGTTVKIKKICACKLNLKTPREKRAKSVFVKREI